MFRLRYRQHVQFRLGYFFRFEARADHHRFGRHRVRPFGLGVAVPPGNELVSFVSHRAQTQFHTGFQLHARFHRLAVHRHRYRTVFRLRYRQHVQFRLGFFRLFEGGSDNRILGHLQRPFSFRITIPPFHETVSGFCFRLQIQHASFRNITSCRNVFSLQTGRNLTAFRLVNRKQVFRNFFHEFRLDGQVPRQRNSPFRIGIAIPPLREHVSGISHSPQVQNRIGWQRFPGNDFLFAIHNDNRTIKRFFDSHHISLYRIGFLHKFGRYNHIGCQFKIITILRAIPVPPFYKHVIISRFGSHIKQSAFRILGSALNLAAGSGLVHAHCAAFCLVNRYGIFIHRTERSRDCQIAIHRE